MVEHMQEIRTRLDNRRVEPSTFRRQSNRNSVPIRVDFADRKDAVDLAQQFRGRVLAAGIS